MSTAPLVEARTTAHQFRLPRIPLGPSTAVSAAALVDGADVRLGESGPVSLHHVNRIDVPVLALDGPRDAAVGSE